MEIGYRHLSSFVVKGRLLGVLLPLKVLKIQNWKARLILNKIKKHGMSRFNPRWGERQCESLFGKYDFRIFPHCWITSNWQNLRPNLKDRARPVLGIKTTSFADMVYRNKRDPDKSELLIKTGTVGGLVTDKYHQLSFPKLQCFDFQNIFLQLCMCYLFEKNQLKRTGIF